MLQNYKIKLSTIPCKHFDGTLGSCNFGRDCFYAHLDKKGKDIKARDRTMQDMSEERQRHRNDRDIDFITEMILMMGLQRHLDRRERRGRNSRGRGRGGRDRRGRRDESDDDDDDDDIEDFLTEIVGTIMEMDNGGGSF